MKHKLRCGLNQRILSIMLCVFTVLGCFSAFPVSTAANYIPAASGETTDINIYINGFKPSDCTPLMINGVTYVPLRVFCNYFGSSEFSWDFNTVTASSDYYTLEVRIGLPYIIANGRYLYYNSTAINCLFYGVTYVPLRSIAKLFGLSITWEQESYSVYVTGSGNIIESGDSYYNTDDLYWLSRIISAESKGEPLSGKIAVGNVIMNRVESSEFPDDIKSVIFDTKNGVQFTPVKNQSLYETPTEESIIAAKICLEGYSVSEAILYFLNEAISTQKWIQNNRTYEFKIENHTFYS